MSILISFEKIDVIVNIVFAIDIYILTSHKVIDENI